MTPTEVRGACAMLDLLAFVANAKREPTYGYKGRALELRSHTLGSPEHRLTEDEQEVVLSSLEAHALARLAELDVDAADPPAEPEEKAV